MRTVIQAYLALFIMVTSISQAQNEDVVVTVDTIPTMDNLIAYAEDVEGNYQRPIEALKLFLAVFKHAATNKDSLSKEQQERIQSLIKADQLKRLANLATTTLAHYRDDPMANPEIRKDDLKFLVDTSGFLKRMYRDKQLREDLQNQKANVFVTNSALPQYYHPGLGDRLLAELDKLDDKQIDAKTKLILQYHDAAQKWWDDKPAAGEESLNFDSLYRISNARRIKAHIQSFMSSVEDKDILLKFEQFLDWENTLSKNIPRLWYSKAAYTEGGQALRFRHADVAFRPLSNDEKKAISIWIQSLHKALLTKPVPLETYHKFFEPTVERISDQEFVEIAEYLHDCMQVNLPKQIAEPENWFYSDEVQCFFVIGKASSIIDWKENSEMHNLLCAPFLLIKKESDGILKWHTAGISDSEIIFQAARLDLK